jgi:hypothetical protein
VTGAIVSIQIPGEPHKNSERYLRTVTDDARVETIRRAVTAMMQKPSDFQIGCKKPDPFGRRRKKAARTALGGEDVIPGCDAAVRKALDSDST